jgi:hypothetical protein
MLHRNAAGPLASDIATTDFLNHFSVENHEHWPKVL